MTDRDLIKAELQNLQKILEAKADMCIGAGKMKLLSFANACSGALELLKEDERRLQEFNRNCYMSDDLPPIGGFHDGSCGEDDLYDTPIGGFHD